MLQGRSSIEDPQLFGLENIHVKGLGIAVLSRITEIQAFSYRLLASFLNVKALCNGNLSNPKREILAIEREC